MDIGRLDCVELKDGAPGTIVDVWEPGSVYEFEPDDRSILAERDIVTITIEREDIARVGARYSDIAK